MDLKAWKFKQRTGGYRKKVRRVYQNMQKLKKTTVCDNSVTEILNNMDSLGTNKNNAPSSSSTNTSEGPVEFVFSISENGPITEEKDSFGTNKNNAPSSSSTNTSECPVDFVFSISDSGPVTGEKCNHVDSDSDTE